jgi:hypothetical protein
MACVVMIECPRDWPRTRGQEVIEKNKLQSRVRGVESNIEKKKKKKKNEMQFMQCGGIPVWTLGHPGSEVGAI